MDAESLTFWRRAASIAPLMVSAEEGAFIASRYPNHRGYPVYCWTDNYEIDHVWPLSMVSE